MKSNFFLQVVSILMTVLFVSTANASAISSQEAQNWAKTNGEILLRTFREPDIGVRYKELDKLFNQYIDIEYIGKFVVGKYWRQMNAEQQEKYQAIFRRYAMALYKTFPLDFVDSLSYEVKDASIEGSFTNVNAVVHVKLSPDNPKQDFLLSFRLHRKGIDIKLVDIKLAESSLLLSYRGKFYQMIANLDDEMEWFIEDLETMTLGIENKNKTNISIE